MIGYLTPYINQGVINTGEAIITPAGALSAKNIIWTAGPVYVDGNNNEPQLLSNAYKNSVELAIRNRLQSMAFPFISAGGLWLP